MSFVCFIFSGCTNNSIDYYGDKPSKIDLRKFFDGDVEGWGSLFDFNGRQTRSFKVDIKGRWEGDTGVLEEWFIFDDGEKTKRIWRISFSDENSFVGSAGDVIGEAKGVINGNAVNLNYVLNIPYKGSTINLSMDDWMYLVEENTIINRTSMKKFGFRVGEIVLVMKKK
jgi:hypothetical protein